jgi:succinylarginine dihydrolase
MWGMTLNAVFDAKVSVIAFPYNDATTFDEKVDITLKYGDTVSSKTTAASFTDSSTTRMIKDYAVSTVFNSQLLNTTGSGLTVICDSTCQARGGEYKSWHTMVTTTWDISGNHFLKLNWPKTMNSTFNQSLSITDRRIFFAVS